MTSAAGQARFASTAAIVPEYPAPTIATFMADALATMPAAVTCVPRPASNYRFGAIF
jgi:hypothetical protein